MTKQTQISINIEQNNRPTEYVVEWHKGRIAAAFAVLTACIAILSYQLSEHGIADNMPEPIEQDGATSTEFLAASPQPVADAEFAKLEPLPTPALEEPSTETALGGLEQDEMMLEDTTEAAASTPAPETLTESVAVAPTPVEINTTEHGQAVITRGHFTSGVSKKEPVDRLDNAIPLAKNGIKRLFYFTEFENYRNHHVVHEWFYEDSLKARVRIGVIGNKYRSYSSKYITSNTPGEWKVVVREVGGPVLQIATIHLTQ